MELVVHIRYKVQSIFPRLGSFRTGHESRWSWSTNSTDAAVVVVGAIVAVAVAVAVAQAHSGVGWLPAPPASSRYRTCIGLRP